ncbi:MAG: carboxypeptidase-like regulatory domain-containing protein [Candidatus Korobacteraceae bacterium]
MFAIRTLAYALFFIIAAATLSPAQQVPPPTPQTATIIGTVLDITGATVPNALVVLQEPHERRTIVTGDNGFFTFEKVEVETPVRVEVSAPDLKSWSSNEIILQPGQSFIVTDITLGVANVETAVNATSLEEVAAEQVKIQEQQRVFGIVPNFYVTYEHAAAPLTPKLKFQLAMKALTDPVTIAGFGMNAAIYQAAGYPSYGQGAAGYGKRLGATFAGGYSNILLGDAVLPSLLHQDPRYFYQGTGTTKSRLLHAMSTPFVARGDDGRREINYSNILSDLASGALANAYYPSQDRGAGLVLRSAAIGIGGRMVFGIVQEFVLHKWTTHHGN